MLLEASIFQVLVLTKLVFLTAIGIKILVYGYCLKILCRSIPAKKIWQFIDLYLTREHLKGSALRLGSFIALAGTYLWLNLKSHQMEDRQILSAWAAHSVLMTFWALCLLGILVRVCLQGIAEARDVAETIRALQRLLRTKKILRGVAAATSILSFAQPLLALKWVAAAGMANHFLLAGRGVGMFEKWLDGKIKSKLKRYIALSLLGAMIESLAKILVIVLAIALVDQSRWLGLVLSFLSIK